MFTLDEARLAMPSPNLTTKEVARLLQVSEATVKRWADDGLLHSSKTAGGHRRFSTHSIATLRREKGIGPALGVPRPQKKMRAASLSSSASFRELLLGGEEKEAAAFLIHAYMEGQSLAALFDKTITEAMHEVGDLWFRGTITVADEHLATRVVLSALQKLRGIAVPAETTGMKAICCGIEGDLHELPVHLTEMILENDGWDARNLGPNTPCLLCATWSHSSARNSSAFQPEISRIWIERRLNMVNCARSPPNFPLQS